jgi:serine/threonine protein phosphatase PrpC
MPDFSLRVESAEISLQGGRCENQDRVRVLLAGHTALLVAVDGMGGHSDGSHAAEVARRIISDEFARLLHPPFNPRHFLRWALTRAHQGVLSLGLDLPLRQRPRATCAVCLMQESASWWAHIGDSRIYHLRARQVLARSHDHSHVEKLVRRGLITPVQAQTHPLRNFVQCCLGGEPLIPQMTLTRRRPVEPDDVCVVCTDGWWSGLAEREIACGLGAQGGRLRDELTALAQRATHRNGKTSDNASAAALRWLGE